MKKKRIIYIMFFMLLVFLSNWDNLVVGIDKNINVERVLYEWDSEYKKNYEELLTYHNLYLDNKNYIVSKVKYRNIYDFKKEIVIYKGFLDSINVGKAVFNNEGLIGVVKHTYEHSSVVELITNEKSEISVKINDAYGILKCRSDKMLVGEVSNYDLINQGDNIYTSGIGRLTGGIYIGKVSKVYLSDNGIEKVIEVELGTNLDKLNYLLIMGD